MANGIKETLLQTDHYRVKRICTKTDNDLKAIMIAHLKTRASEQQLNGSTHS